ncbi:MAG TPA: tRNA pseudouridine(55) synthase TruB [Candidatus Limnocylindria bacterium]|nr:tRNA pseudouridine(55) synthase TruB [Candidatus Limnocylindria bacterium]
MISPNGVLPVDKPRGWTSHDVVAVARGALGTTRIGHGGTLDPLATGVLPLLLGPATKFADRLHTASKAYAGLVVFGTETETDDAEGSATRSADPPSLDAAALERMLEEFRGEIAQVPPSYAAVKVRGRHAYARARAGEQFALAPRRVRIERLAVATWDTPLLRLLVVCSTGTYIRSIARDLGRAAGSAAHLGGLRRLAVGGLAAADALTVEDLRRGTPSALRGLRAADDRILELEPRLLADPADSILADWGLT